MHRLITPDMVGALESEDAYQKSRWPNYNPPGREHDDRSLDEWILYIEEYATQARTQTTRGDEDDALDTIRKIASMALHCMRKHGAPRREGF